MYLWPIFSMMISKRYILSISAINLLFFTVLGGVPDSLENRLKRATSDTAKVMVYNSCARELLTGPSSDYYQMQQYSQRGRRNENYKQALQYAQQGLILAEEAHFDKGRAELYRTLGSAYLYLNDYEKAVEHYGQALNICEKLQDLNGMAMNYYNIAIVYNAQQTKTYYRLENLQRALSLWKQAGNTNYMVRAYRSIITLYRNAGELRLAETYAQEALNLAIETGNRQEEAQLYYNEFSQIAFLGGNKQARDEYYQKAYQIYQELGNQLRMAALTFLIAANTYSENPDTAIVLLRKAAAIYEKESPTDLQLFDVYNTLADMFQIQNFGDSARYYKEKALNKAILSGIQRIIATAYETTGRFYLDNGDINRAEKDFQKAYDVALKSGLYNMQSISLRRLSNICYRKGDYKTAFEYLQKYQHINDSLTMEDNKRNVQQLSMQYEFEKDMAENTEMIKAQLERQQQAIKYQKTVVAIVSVALIGVAVLLLFIIRSNRLKNMANAKLEQQHREILRINNELKESHRELSRYKDSLEEMVKRQTAKLQQNEMQLRTLSDNLPGGCIYQKLSFPDGKQMITYISNTAERWLGMNAEALMDDINVFYRKMMPEDVEEKRRLERESIRTMSPHTFEYRLKKGEQEIWLLENVMPRAEKNQRIVWDGIVVDITERKKFEKELIKAKEQAEESDRLKSAFLANMSHEIRTPMNGIIGFLNFIERDDLDAEKRHDYTGIIQSNVQQLLQLVGDIVDISKMDSHQLALHRVAFDLNALLSELEIFFHDFILKRDRMLELICVLPDLPSRCNIYTDPIRLRQILSNLIGNAVKFTDKGYIRFGCQLTDVSPDCTSGGTELYFFVEDTGIGIPESKQKYIFERFRQVHDERMQSKYGGTGLGLAISKNLVEMMGGQIGVMSEAGMGSTFYFTLPYCRIDEEKRGDNI